MAIRWRHLGRVFAALPIAASLAASAAVGVDETDRLAGGDRLAVRESVRYRVASDDPRVDLAAASLLLESFRDHFEAFWRGRVDLRPYDRVSRVYLLRGREPIDRILGRRPIEREYRPGGHYRASLDLVLLDTVAVPPGLLPEMLVHEAAHQMIEKRLFSGAAPRALWLDEGLSQYFAFTHRYTTGEFRSGEIGGKSVPLVRGARAAGEALARVQHRKLKEVLRDGSRWSLDALIRITDARIFYGQGVELRYTASWLLVHFLLHGDGGARSQAFIRYLQREGSGGSGAAGLYEELRLQPSALEAAYRSYVARLRIP